MINNMKAADLFIAGVSIIGILAIIKAIQVLTMTVSPLVGTFGQEFPDWVITQQLIAWVYPLVLFFMGIYLLSGVNRIVKRFYPHSEQIILSSAREVFKLAMKITGMVLIVYAIPELFRIISNGLYVGYYYRFGIDTFNQQLILTQGTLSTLVSLLFGFYLLYSGKFFESIAFKDEEPED